LHTKASGGSTGRGMGSGAAATCVGVGRVRRCGRCLGGTAWTRGAHRLGEQGGRMAVPGAAHGPTDQGPASTCGPSGPWRGDSDAGAGVCALERQSANPTRSSTV
jgi:hypothetical protein